MNASIVSVHWLKAGACVVALGSCLLSHGAHAANPGPALPQGGAARDLRQHAPQLELCRVDLGVLPIEYQLERRIDQFKGMVKVTATVKNVGLQPYESRARQQALHLYQDGHLVATKPFVNLNVGQAVSVSFVRRWSISSPAEGEFPPTYKAEIGYDPDILQDANPRNDDCNPKNNSVSRSGSEIAQLF